MLRYSKLYMRGAKRLPKKREKENKMKKIYWKFIASELVDAMLTVESEEEVIKRLLSMMTVKQLKSLDWFDSEIIDKIY